MEQLHRIGSALLGHLSCFCPWFLSHCYIFPLFFSQILEPDCAGVGNVNDLSLLNYWGNPLSIPTKDFVLMFVTSEPI